MAEQDLTLSRRDLLRLGLVAGPASLMAACGWEGGAGVQSRLSAIARLNDWVGEHVLLSGSRLAKDYPVSARSSAMPNYHVAPRTPALENPNTWSLNVGGLVRVPMRLRLEELQALPRTTYTVKHHCVEGWTTIASWAGVPLSVIAGLVRPTDAARYVRFDSFDVAPDGTRYYNGWDLKSALHPQTMVAYAFNDRPLMPDHGAPARLYSPIKLGYKLTKYLTNVTFTDKRPGGYWEDQGYPWLGGI
jgi:DMSO/TMAO reductase YedYZ molybdopterin-dependent catalytic subunit